MTEVGGARGGACPTRSCIGVALACAFSAACWAAAQDGAPGDPGIAGEVRELLARGAYADAEARARAALDSLSGAGQASTLAAAELHDALVVALSRGGRASSGDAAELAEHGVRIKAEILGANHPSLATSLDNAGVLFFVRGEYRAALERYDRALAIFDSAAASEPRHRADLATVHSHLGPLYQELGQYSTALRHYGSALDLYSEALEPADTRIAMSQNNLATLLTRVGDYAPALELYRTSLASLERALGSEHPLLGTSKHNQAELLQRMGRADEAVELYRQALATKERTLGTTHPSVAITLSNLGYLYTDRGEAVAGDSLAARAVAMVEAAYGTEHVDLAYGLVSRGRAQDALGSAEEARRSLVRAVDLRTAALGEGHPLLVAPLFHLGQALARAERPREAFEVALRAEAVGREHLRLTARGAPDRQALRYAAERPPTLDLAISLAADLDDPSVTVAAWDALIRSRAVVLDEMASRHRLAVDAGTPESRRALGIYRTAAERLSNLLLRGPGADLGGYRAQVGTLRAEMEDAERTLGATFGFMMGDATPSDVGLDEVRGALPPGASLVAFARVDGGPAATHSAEYVAFVLADARVAPRVVRLGPAGEIESAVRRWRDEMIPEAPARDPLGHEAAGARLRELLWDPLGIPTEGDRLVLLVPAGAVHLVSFVALPLPDGRALAEADVLLHELSSERDVLVDDRAPADEQLLAVGGVVHEASASGPSAGTCTDLLGRGFPALPGSLAEIRGIAATWERGDGSGRRPARELVQGAATEAAFKREAPGKTVVHLATHGFFFSNDCATDPAAGTSPLQLSGLVLAGDQGAYRSGASDGVLLAEEVATLDFSDASWVVLSGCDTGLGGIQVDEGMLGLRRAFQVAGAGTVIMSLWPVEDRSTQAFMATLYRARFEEQRSTAASMRQAYRDALSATRREHGHAHPLYWAPFIASGDWR